jgi:multiple antibiotic resistance protein
VIDAFLIALPALFSIVNPISAAFIFREVTADRAPSERARIARRVAVNALLVMIVALLAGSYILAFFGISLAALRCAGGIVVALSAWELLHKPESREARKQEQAAESIGQEDIALFPLTIPFTTGPGTIAVAVALGSGHPARWAQAWPFYLGMSAATVVLAVIIWITFLLAVPLTRLLGQNGSRTVSRLFAFLLLAIGAQILIAGVQDVLGPLLAGAR